MEDVSALVARQYEAFAYPRPIDNLAEFVARGSFFMGEPRLYAPVLWPGGRPPGRLRILVAGCGTTHAAYTAYMNREDEVIGVDLSKTSLGHQRFLQDQHGLHNMKLFLGDLRDVAGIGHRFDVILCSGVLHHMADPGAGLAALREVLLPDGVLTVMVYGQTNRVGVYMLQDAFRRMAIESTAEGVATVRSILSELPPLHCALPYINSAKELEDDSALVDTFLHPQDRAYTVPQVLDLIETAGLEFQNWVDNAQYWRNGMWGSNSAVAKAIDPLPDRDHWAIVEMLRQNTGMHAFTARHRGVEPVPKVDFARSDWFQFTPHRSPGFVKAGDGQYQRGSSILRCSPVEGFIIECIDGNRSIAGIFSVPALSQIPPEQRDASGRAFFEHLWKLGHVMIALPR